MMLKNISYYIIYYIIFTWTDHNVYLGPTCCFSSDNSKELDHENSIILKKSLLSTGNGFKINSINRFLKEHSIE